MEDKVDHHDGTYRVERQYPDGKRAVCLTTEMWNSPNRDELIEEAFAKWEKR